MVKFAYGHYENGNAIEDAVMEFNEIYQREQYEINATDDKDLTGRTIRNILNSIKIIEVHIGTDEILNTSKYAFLVNFLTANLTWMYFGMQRKLISLRQKGMIPIEISEDGRQVMKLIFEVHDA